MSELRTNKIVPRDGLPSGASGGIIQVVSVTKTDAESLQSGTVPALIPGMSATITPQSASNKILVMVVLYASVGGSFAAHYAVLRRDSTDIAIGDAAGSRNRVTLSLQDQFYSSTNSNAYGPHQGQVIHLDSPGTTSPVTYGLYHVETDASGASNGNALYINRSASDTDTVNHNRTVSSITLMEISG